MLGSFETKDDAIKAIEALCNKLSQEQHDEESANKIVDCIRSTRLRRGNKPTQFLWLDYEINEFIFSLRTTPDS